MKVVTWSERRGRFMLELPGGSGLLVVDRLGEEWAWEYKARNPRDDVRGRAANAEEGMAKAFKAATRAGMVEA
jgi:hypothetical protein